MYRAIIITILALFFFLVEFLLFNVLGGAFKPDLLLILVVFFNLYLGIRHSLAAAFISGCIKDSFGAHVFGLNIVSFLFCAYMTTFIKRYLDYLGSGSSRILIVFLVSIVNVAIQYVLSLIFYPVDFRQLVSQLFFPQIVLTTLVAGTAFRVLRKCVKRFSI